MFERVSVAQERLSFNLSINRSGIIALECSFTPSVTLFLHTLHICCYMTPSILQQTAALMASAPENYNKPQTLTLSESQSSLKP